MHVCACVCVRVCLCVRLNVSLDSPKITCSSVGAYLGDTDVTVECAVRAKPPPTTMFWIVDVNGTVVSDKDDSPNLLVVNKVTYCSLILKCVDYFKQ